MTATVMTGVAGVDASKARLDVSVDGGEVRSFGNGGSAILELAQWLETRPVALVMGEPAWGCEKPLVQGLRQAGFPVCLAHPNKVRAFAKAGGRRAKTVRLGAQTLSQYGRVFAQGRESPAGPEPEREEVQALRRRGRQLVDQQDARAQPPEPGLEPANRGLCATAHRLAGRGD